MTVRQCWITLEFLKRDSVLTMSWRGDPEKKRAYEREYNSTPEQKKKRRLYRKWYRLTHPDKVKAGERKSRSKAKSQKKQKEKRGLYSPKRINEVVEIIKIIKYYRLKSYLKNVPDRKIKWAQLKEDLETEMRTRIKIAA